MTADQQSGVYRKLGFHLPLSILLLLAIALTGLGKMGLKFNRSTTWFVILLLMSAFAVLVGHGITGYWRGILIDTRRKMSLSRFQLLAWTLLILSALFTAILSRVGLTSDPMNVSIPSELWVLLGISMASAVASPVILNTKREKKPDPAELARNLRSVKRSEQKKDEDINATSMILENTQFEAARWSELLKGDESGNAASVDIGKLQMLFFTFILILSYGATIASLFSGNALVNQLPAVGSGMSTLLGISHAGYLAGKAASNSKEAPDQNK
jgi:hypothetical protein